MKTDEKLDLRSIAAPYCFLICKSTLASMKPGAILEIHVEDPETFRDLLIILDRSGEKIVAEVKSEDGFRLRVQKGAAERSALPIRPEKMKNG